MYASIHLLNEEYLCKVIIVYKKCRKCIKFSSKYELIYLYLVYQKHGNKFVINSHLVLLFICSSIHLSLYQSACLSFCVSLCLSAYLSVYLSVCLTAVKLETLSSIFFISNIILKANKYIYLASHIPLRKDYFTCYVLNILQ